jgi:glycosyltransferase involved in cell wall biosynthesis
MRIAYFINQYPKVSHSFIRREILALTRQGFEITRIALRGWDGELVDAEDARERAVTRYVLRRGPLGLLWPTLQTLLRGPARFFSALGLAWRMSRHADRPWPYHLVYLAEACQVLQWLRGAGVAHLHAHFGTNSAEVTMLAHALGGPPFSFTVHGPEEFDKPEFIHLAEKIRRAAFAVAISSFGRSQLFRWAAHDQWDKIAVVHCGLEPAFHEVPAVPPPAAPRLVCVGRLCEQKGQLLLVEAVRVLTQRGVKVKLVLAGDGEMRRAVEGLIALYGLQQQIEITGWISSEQVRAEILAAWALVLPSFAEGLPVVVMEAMALRRPVLTTYVAGIPELVQPGENGWLFPAGSVDALVEAMADCLAQPPEMLASLGEAARQRVLARHDIDTEAAKLARLFRKASAV